MISITNCLSALRRNVQKKETKANEQNDKKTNMEILAT